MIVSPSEYDVLSVVTVIGVCAISVKNETVKNAITTRLALDLIVNTLAFII
jgi:hypothetical protein